MFYCEPKLVNKLVLSAKKLVCYLRRLRRQRLVVEIVASSSPITFALN